MQHALIPPREPQGQEHQHPPMIYVTRHMTWEYKQIIRNLESETPLDDAELKSLGEDGWEMTGVAQQPPLTYFYFKRQIDR